MKTVRFNPLDPLGVFERRGRKNDPSGTRVEARQVEINRFLADVRKNIPDEQMAHQEYTRMSNEAKRLGLDNAARTLLQMAQDEGRHKINLQNMAITVW